MRPAGEYQGREQTYLKHFFLERYLERVAYNIGSFMDEFVYVDGFSGPWRSEHEEFEDTSFMIAIGKLRRVRDALNAKNRGLRIRCLFVEKDPEAFKKLKTHIDAIDDLEAEVLEGSFEDLTPAVCRFIGSAFALVFIDPTGWKGLALDKIAPLLQGRGEVLINFMDMFVRRFVDEPGQLETFRELFGGAPPSEAGEDARVMAYVAALKRAGNFPYATFTRILSPLKEETYFHLVYGTKNPKGLEEFRKVEKQLFSEQNKVRAEAKQARRIRLTGQPELFPALAQAAGGNLVALRAEALDRASDLIIELVEREGHVRYETLKVRLLEHSLVWTSDINDLVQALRETGRYRLLHMNERQRVFGKGHIIAPAAAPPA